MGVPAVQRLNWKKLGEKFKELRDAHGWNQKQAAKAVKRSQPDLSTFENGNLQLTVEALTVWADAMGISIDECFDVLMHIDEETSLSEEDAIEVLGWSLKDLKDHREQLGAWKNKSGRWLYSTYAVHNIERQESFQRYMAGH